MSDVHRRAVAAQTLLDDPTFREILNEIQDDAIAAFLRTTATPAELEAAHQKVRAVETIRAAIQQRLDNDAVQQKKDHHRNAE